MENVRSLELLSSNYVVSTFLNFHEKSGSPRKGGRLQRDLRYGDLTKKKKIDHLREMFRQRCMGLTVPSLSSMFARNSVSVAKLLLLEKQ